MFSFKENILNINASKGRLIIHWNYFIRGRANCSGPGSYRDSIAKSYASSEPGSRRDTSMVFKQYRLIFSDDMGIYGLLVGAYGTVGMYTHHLITQPRLNVYEWSKHVWGVHLLQPHKLFKVTAVDLLHEVHLLMMFFVELLEDIWTFSDVCNCSDHSSYSIFKLNWFYVKCGTLKKLEGL